MTFWTDARAHTAAIPRNHVIAWGVAALAMALLSFDLRLMNDGDTFWHIRAGEWMLDHRAVPHADMFTATRAGQPWFTYEWLSEVVMALAYRGAGFGGVMLLSTMAIGAAMTPLMLFLLRRLSIPTALITAAVALACAAPNLLARPHVLALPVMLIWTGALLDARSAGRAPSFALLPLMALWANLHGGFIFGIAFIAPLALEALVDGRPRAQIVQWALFGFASVGAALLTPAGIGGLLAPLQVLSMKALPLGGEWIASDFSKPSAFEAALALVVTIIVTRRVSIPIVRLLVLLGLTHMALQHGRYQLMFGLIGAMAIADSLASAFPRGPARTINLYWAPAAAVAIALIAGLRLAAPVRLPERITNPASAIAAIPDDLRDKPMFNEYAFGGALIFEGLRPYIDSRMDVFGDDFLMRYEAATKGDRATVNEIFKTNAIGWTILAKQAPLVDLLDHTPGWRRLYADDVAVIEVNDACLNRHICGL